MHLLLRTLLKPKPFYMPRIMQPARKTKMKVVPKVATYEPFLAKNFNLKRPLSPHLSIYRMQMTTLLSISHRISGIILVAFNLTFAINAIVNPHELSYMIAMFEGLQLSALSLVLLKCGIAYPFCFHGCGGVRQLLWATGRCLTLSGLYKTGYAVLGGSLLLTLALAGFTFENEN